VVAPTFAKIRIPGTGKRHLTKTGKNIKIVTFSKVWYNYTFDRAGRISEMKVTIFFIFFCAYIISKLFLYRDI
jgi:hypothetical protein